MLSEVLYNDLKRVIGWLQLEGGYQIFRKFSFAYYIAQVINF
jgi:hypothetical protein